MAKNEKNTWIYIYIISADTIKLSVFSPQLGRAHSWESFRSISGKGTEASGYLWELEACFKADSQWRGWIRFDMDQHNLVLVDTARWRFWSMSFKEVREVYSCLMLTVKWFNSLMFIYMFFSKSPWTNYKVTCVFYFPRLRVPWNSKFMLMKNKWSQVKEDSQIKSCLCRP